jgi:hypothetical protein
MASNEGNHCLLNKENYKVEDLDFWNYQEDETYNLINRYSKSGNLIIYMI